MKFVRKIMIIAFVLSLSFSFISLAYTRTRNEGMLAIRQTETEAKYGYQNGDGTIAVNEWRQVWGYWYYFDENGNSKQNTWAEIDGKWYYFDHWSRMLHDTTTPDGYYVGSDGEWTEGATEATEPSGPAQ